MRVRQVHERERKGDKAPGPRRTQDKPRHAGRSQDPTYAGHLLGKGEEGMPVSKLLCTLRESNDPTPTLRFVNNNNFKRCLIT